MLSKKNASHELVERFRKKLGEVKVLTENGSHRTVKETLIRQRPLKQEQDEVLVTGFAHDSVIASSQYSAEALEFIARCRRETTPYNINKLIEWVSGSVVERNIEKQKAVCWYIVHGRMGTELAEKLKSTYRPFWLFRIDVKHLEQWGWQKRDIDLFRNERMVTDGERNSRVENQLKKEGRSNLSPGEALDRIYNWWTQKCPVMLKDYDGELYPNGRFDWQAIKEDNQPERYREAWLKLFFLGSCQTIGRTREIQHRAALDDFDNNGWWQTFIKPDVPADWFKVMNEYLAKAINGDKYRTWLQILPLYRFSKHLDDYIDLFWSADSGLPNVDDLIRPGSSAALSGAGFAPPELKATLGIGANFILRELYRNGVYSDASLEKHCFVASQGVRRLLGERLPEGLNLDGASADHSQKIYQFLCKHIGEERATFNGAFDIPLRLLAREDNRLTLESILEIGVWN